MKINMSAPNIYLLVLSTVLLLFVLLFSFLVLIPKGKQYREQRIELKKANYELRRYQNFNDKILEKLKKLQAKNRHVIVAFKTIFNPDRFEKQNTNYFKSLKLSKVDIINKKDEFDIYEVNTTSKINSPESFYKFLDALNKSDWIVGVNFPIDFKRDGNFIKSSFTMKVFTVRVQN